MANLKWKIDENFGKVPKQKADQANRNIDRILASNKTLEQKADAIIKEFSKAYAGTGVNMQWDKNAIIKMLQEGRVPHVSDARPPR